MAGFLNAVTNIWGPYNTGNCRLLSKDSSPWSLLVIITNWPLE